MPLLLLIITSFGKLEKQFGGSLFLIGLCITYGLVSTTILGYAVNTARERERGVFQRLRVTPARTWTIMASRLTNQVIANLIIALVVLVVGAEIHRLSLSADQYALVLAASVIGGAVFLSIGQALVGLVTSGDTVDAAGRMIYIGLMVLGVFGLTGGLGRAGDSIAKWSPVGTS